LVCWRLNRQIALAIVLRFLYRLCCTGPAD
jgi:hypothetical protein